MSNPTHTLVIKDRNSGGKTYAGAGWANEKGWISIKLNPGVTLKWDDDVWLNLYPKRGDEHDQSSPPPDQYEDNGDSDIPF